MAIPATYSIHVYGRNGNNIHAKVFQGAQAFSDASSYLDEVKRWDQAVELWFTRMDGPEPVFVCKPLVRSEDGKWQEETDNKDR